MKALKLSLKNFRTFSDIEVDFDKRTSVIIGHNGAGKTSILDAIAICMTHFTGELLSTQEGYNIDRWFVSNDISIGEKKGSCKITIQQSQINDNKEFSIEVLKDKHEKGLKFNKIPENCPNELKDKLKKDIVKSIPVIAYFSVHRTYQNSEIDEGSASKKVYNNLLHAYERSLDIKSPSFSVFEKWFIQQTIKENEYKIKSKDLEAELPSLKFIRNCLNNFFTIIEPDVFGSISTRNESETMPGFEVDYSTELIINKNGSEILLSQLSDGERMVIGLVVETARRLFLANRDKPKNGDGIVLIDEIELHIHPKWQKNIIKALEDTFPKLKFIFTTHSPLVLSGMQKESIKVFKDAEEVPNEMLPDIYTATADEILTKLMNADDSFNPYQEEIDEIDKLFNEMKFDQAYEKLEQLKGKVQSNPEWLKGYEERIAFARS